MKFGFTHFVCAVAVVSFAVLPASAQLTGYQSAPAFFDAASSMGPYAWVNPGDSRAIVGGSQPDAQLYVCRSNIGGAWHYGKVYVGHCNIGLNSEQVTTSYQVLVSNDSSAYFPQTWIAPNTMPATAMCRASYNGGTHPGEVRDGACHIGWGGNDVPMSSYSVLSLPNGMNIVAAITKQINSVIAGDKIETTLELVTVVAYPANLNYVSLTMPAGFTIKTATPNNVACTNVAGTTCKQRWTWTIDPGKNCTLNGSYKANFNRSCAAGASCGTGVNSVAMTLASENFCSTTTVNGK
jgi:hypothetical protein